METIDALADAINVFEGGLVLVSHDFRLINQVAEEIWVCEKQTVTKWQGDIIAYKEHLKEKVMRDLGKGSGASNGKSISASSSSSKLAKQQQQPGARGNW